MKLEFHSVCAPWNWQKKKKGLKALADSARGATTETMPVMAELKADHQPEPGLSRRATTS